MEADKRRSPAPDEPEVAPTEMSAAPDGARESLEKIEQLEPGVDPESARTSDAVRSGDLPDV